MHKVQKPLCLIHFWVIPFSPFSAPAASSLPLSGVIRNGSPQYGRKEGGKFSEQNLFNRLQMVQFECPRVIHILVSCTTLNKGHLR